MIKLEQNKLGTNIIIGNSETILPGNSSQGSKEPILIFKDGIKRMFYYSGFNSTNGQRSLLIEGLTLYTVNYLFTDFRDESMSIIKNIASALKQVDESFLDLKFGVIELFRLYFTKDGTVVLLPKDLAYIISLHLDDEDRINMHGDLVNHNFLATYSIQGFLSQLVYYSCLGFFPYSLVTVREKNNTIKKVSFYIESVDKNLDNMLKNDLSPSLRYQRKCCPSNYLCDNIDSWLNRYKNVKIPNDKVKQLSAEKLKVLEKEEKLAKRKIFFRKKGGLIAIVTSISAIAIGIIVWFIYINTKAPYTKDFTPEQIVSAYYQSQNELNYDHLVAALGSGVESPVSDEILNLFVTYKMRQAYEHIDAVVSPKTYNQSEVKTLPQGGFIYGVDDVNIKKIDYLTYEIKFIEYRPKPIENDGKTLPTFITTEKSRVIQQIKLEQHKRGYYLITEIKTLHKEIIGDMTTKYEIKKNIR